jgi:hypothetical protein
VTSFAQHLTDSRHGNTQLPLADLLRRSVYSRIAGYEDVNDAERRTTIRSSEPISRNVGSCESRADFPLADR